MNNELQENVPAETGEKPLEAKNVPNRKRLWFGIFLLVALLISLGMTILMVMGTQIKMMRTQINDDVAILDHPNDDYRTSGVQIADDDLYKTTSCGQPNHDQLGD